MTDYTTDKLPSGLDVLTSLADDDILVAGDTSDSGKVKGITKANLLSSTAFTSGARAYRNTSAQTIANSTATKIQLNAESWDLAANFDPVINFRFTAAIAGKYQVNAAIYWVAATNGNQFRLMIYKNGANAGGQILVPGSTQDAQCSASDIIDLAIGEYIELYGIQDSGGNIDVKNGSEFTYMSIQRVY